MIRGTKRIISETKQFDANVNIHNRFDIEVIDAATGVKKQEAKAYNVVCNNLWTELGKSDANLKTRWFAKITYGRGTGTPSAEDTDLFSTIATVNATDMTYGYDYEQAVCWVRKCIHINELTSNGETITEMGIRSTDGVLCTHAMLRDMNGNQISIVKGDTDILNIYATVYVHFSPELVDVNNAVQVNLTEIRSGNSFLRWLAGDTADLYSHEGGLRMFCPLKGRLTTTGVTWVSGSKKYDAANRVFSLTGRCPYDVNNDFKGLGWWSVARVNAKSGSGQNPQIAIKAIPPVFNGSKVVDEEVGTGDGVTVDFATKFDYPENAKVYVNGEPCVDVVVDKVPLYNTHMGQYFEAGEVKNGKFYPKFNLLLENNVAIGTSDHIVFDQLGDMVLYNPNHMHGISTFYAEVNNYYYDCSGLAVSDDLVNWHYLRGDGTSNISGGTITVPEEHRFKKYFKLEITRIGILVPSLSNFVATNLTGYNIHFTTPPAEGAVITIDYDTPIIAKDVNHVFDLSVTLHLGEYTEN